VLLLALVYRLTNLFPIFYYGDDAEYGIVARSLASDPRGLAYPDIEGFGAHPFVSQPPLVIYLFALAARLVGSVETGAVLVSVLLGAATCGLVYAIGVRVQGRITGSIAGLFLAVVPSHVSLSREALLDVGLTFFMTLTVLCVLVWLHRRTMGWALATGGCAAATLLSKLPGFLVLAPLGAALVYAWWTDGRAEVGTRATDAAAPRRRDVHHAAWALVPLAAPGLVYLALIWYLRASRDLFEKLGWQIGRVSSSEGTQGSRLPRAWHWYFSDPDQNLFMQFGLGVVLLALVGALFLAWRAWQGPERRAAALVLLLWPFTILAFFIVSHRKEWFYILPAAPGLVVLAALPLGYGFAHWRALAERTPVRTAERARPFVVATLAVVFTLALAPPAVQAARDVLEEHAYGYGVKEAALWIHEQAPESAQVGTLLGRFTLHFYNGQDTYHWFVPHDFVESEIQAGRVRYLVWDTYLNLTYEQDWMGDLVSRHDGQSVAEYRSDSGRLRVVVYELRPAEPEAA
jgi:4-amino-4-deoxy-L-arabinose transferase-like glycosyltransferase